MTKRDLRKVEFGDFQTPDALAEQVVAILKARGLRPKSVIEPTCGLGSFVLAAMNGFESLSEIFALEINAEYFAQANARLAKEHRRPLLDLRQADFFSFDWRSLIRDLPDPILLLGNPPWVTSSGLGAIRSTNLPRKSNFQGHRGLDAITGKGNFDIAEWMLIKLIEGAAGRQATLAMLVKTSTARRVLRHVWQSDIRVGRAAAYRIDAAEHFGVAASACLLVCDLSGSSNSKECDLFSLDEPTAPNGTMALRQGALVADAQLYDRHQCLIATKSRPNRFRWRSGVKHDCSAIMELHLANDGVLTNGIGEEVELEPLLIYPMMKGSEVARVGGVRKNRWMLVPQRLTGDDTAAIRHLAPKTWAYLARHGALLDQRASSIYRNRPRFSVFGIGAYTFAPWKVAICGLYKRLEFALIGPEEGKPVVFDDTVYHLSFNSEIEARTAVDLLNSDQCRELFQAFIFWDAKRPITADVLHRLDFEALAHSRGAAHVFSGHRTAQDQAELLWTAGSTHG